MQGVRAARTELDVRLHPCFHIPELCPGGWLLGVISSRWQPLRWFVPYLPFPKPWLPSWQGCPHLCPVTWAPKTLRTQSLGRDTDSSSSGLRSTVRCEGVESSEGQGKHHLCQHLGREEDNGEGLPGTFISSPPQAPGSTSC